MNLVENRDICAVASLFNQLLLKKGLEQIADDK